MRKRPERTERTKADLKEAFWHLYSERPIEKIAVGEVCALAGYNRATFYLHFKDIYDVLECIESELLEGTTSCVEACMKKLEADACKANLVAACADVVLYYERNKPFIVVLLGEQGDPAFVRRLKDDLKPLWRRYVVRSGSAHTDQELDLLLEYTLSGTLFMISRWLAEPGTTSARRLAHLVYDFAIKDTRLRSLE